MKLPMELVDKMRALKDEFPEVFENLTRLNVRWNIADDTFIFEILKDGASYTIIK